jgi:colanic acid/amylovoran biosynthesis glycosyltransferase
MLSGSSDKDDVRLGIITSSFPFGSAEMFLAPELDALSDLGYKLTLFPATPRGQRGDYTSLKAETVRFPLLAPKTLICAIRGLARNVRGFLSCLETILRANSRLGTKLKNLALLPTGLAVGDAVWHRKIGHIHAYWLSGASTVGMVAARVANVEWSYSAHSYDIFMADNLIAEKAKRAKFGRAISQLGQRAILSHLGKGGGQVEVIHLGVLTDKKQPCSDDGVALNSVRILCPTATLIPVKGQQYLLEAARLVIDAGLPCYCTITGEGKLLRDLASCVQRLRLNGFVSMPGRLSHAAFLEQLHSGLYDMVVLPSVELGHEFEGIPVSLMEAMAAGIPCIATRTGAISELIPDERCGILVEQRDSQALSDAILMLARNPNRRKDIIVTAAKRIDQAFNARSSAQALADLIRPNVKILPACLPQTV